MKILHVTTSVDPAQGGVAESILRRGVELARLGHQVSVASLDSPNAASQLKYPLQLFPLGPGTTAWGYSNRLGSWLRKNASNFDVMIVDGIWQYHGLAVRSAARNAGVPYYVYVHGMLDPWFKHAFPIKHLKKWLFWPWSDYRVLRDAKSVLFTCEEELLLAKQSFWLYRCSARVVPFGTARPPNLKGFDRAQWLKSKGLSADRRYLLFLGRLHPKKGLDILIRGLGKVKDIWPQLDVIVAGPGELAYVKELKAITDVTGVADRVHWLGMLEGEEKWSAFNSAEAFVLCSHQENFGIAVVEALALGLPVLISNKVNIWREIKGCGAGVVAEDTESGAVSLINDWMGASDTERFEMGRAASHLFDSSYTVEQMAVGLVQVCGEAVEQEYVKS